MSRENVEVIREAHAAFNAHDLDRFLAGWQGDCEYKPALEAGLEGGAAVYHGHEGIRRWWREMGEAWSDMHSEIQDIRDVGAGRLLVSTVVLVRAEAGEIELKTPFFQVVTIRDGRVVSSHDFSTEAEAVEAVGLSE